MNNGRDSAGKGQGGDPAVLACVIFQTRDPEQLVQVLEQTLTGIAAHSPAAPSAPPLVPLQKDSDDPWFKHTGGRRISGDLEKHSLPVRLPTED